MLKGTCPNSDYMSEHVITLPLHLQITEEEVDKVIENVIEVRYKMKKKLAIIRRKCSQ